MRAGQIVCVAMVVVACNNHADAPPPQTADHASAATDAPATNVAQPSDAPSAAADHSLAMADVVLLVPDDEVGKAVTTDALATAVKAVATTVHDYDRDHPHALPDLVEAWVAFKPKAKMRVWLTERDGTEIAVSDLDHALAAIPGPDTTAVIALMVHLTRDGAAPPPPSEMRTPIAWRKPGTSGTVIDVIAAIWPD